MEKLIKEIKYYKTVLKRTSNYKCKHDFIKCVNKLYKELQDYCRFRNLDYKEIKKEYDFINGELIMKLKRIRDIKQKDIPHATYLSLLQKKGFLHKYYDDEGYLCVDLNEVKEYYSKSHMGRPRKAKEEN